MAVTTGSFWDQATLVGPTLSRLQLREVRFKLSGTYAQADGSKLAAIGAAITAASFTGKTLNIVAAMPGTPATKSDGSGGFMGLTSVSISGSDVLFHVTDGDFTTELANGAIPDQSRPFTLWISFYETDFAGNVSSGL